MKIIIQKLISNKFLNISSVFNKNKESKYLVVFIKKTFGFKPINLSLYKLAVRHKSKSRVLKGIVKNSNERLEFLGDAVLNCTITDILFRQYPYKSEGFLTELRARIVNRDHLNELASKIGITNYIDCSNDFKRRLPARGESLLGNALEALIGAVYLDRGYDKIYECIKKIVDNYIDLDTLAVTENNYKSRLIEFCQKHNKRIIFSIKESKSRTLKFTASISIDEEPISTGVGPNKKIAERQASEIAYKLLVR